MFHRDKENEKDKKQNPRLRSLAVTITDGIALFGFFDNKAKPETGTDTLCLLRTWTHTTTIVLLFLLTTPSDLLDRTFVGSWVLAPSEVARGEAKIAWDRCH